MLNSNTFGIDFIPRRLPQDKSLCRIYARITVDGIEKEFSLKQLVLVENWDSAKERLLPLQRSYIRTLPTEALHFTASNPNSILLTFAALDNCLFGPGEITRCDFMIGNADKTYFVEIKEVGRKRNRQGARSKATDQLSTTITYFKARTDLLKLKL